MKYTLGLSLILNTVFSFLLFGKSDSQQVVIPAVLTAIAVVYNLAIIAGDAMKNFENEEE